MPKLYRDSRYGLGYSPALRTFGSSGSITRRTRTTRAQEQILHDAVLPGLGVAIRQVALHVKANIHLSTSLTSSEPKDVLWSALRDSVGVEFGTCPV